MSPFRPHPLCEQRHFRGPTRTPVSPPLIWWSESFLQWKPLPPADSAQGLCADSRRFRLGAFYRRGQTEDETGACQAEPSSLLCALRVSRQA